MPLAGGRQASPRECVRTSSKLCIVLASGASPMTWGAAASTAQAQQWKEPHLPIEQQTRV